MIVNNLKYTTEAIKAAIAADKDIGVETKAEEEAKPVISDDAFALCEMIYNLQVAMKR